MRIISFPRALDRPRELPELRAALLTSTEEGGIWEQAEFERLLGELVGSPAVHETTKDGARVIMGPKGYDANELTHHVHLARDHARNGIRWFKENLPGTQLIHVTEHMCEFIRQAATSVPESLTIHRDDAPSPSGLVVFQTPMWGTDAGPADPGAPIRVDGIMWGPVHLVDRVTPWFMEPPEDHEGVEGVSIASLRMMEPNGTVPTLWVVLGRTDWPWGDRLDQSSAEAVPGWNEAKQRSFEEDRRLLAAVWATINQKLLVDAEIVFPDKHATKRLQRAGLGDLDNKITIVHLRKTEYRSIGYDEGSGKPLATRTLVRKHYKRQPYGPGRSLRKLIVVMPYWRGPDDAPISHTERIWEVDR
ncbi:MAG TPA: hypothetical protein VFX15_00130 [Actinomycetes bacterium]|nr:hypothetical protein [Actinomycetes bacterium]